MTTAKIVTTTNKVFREVEETTERVHLDMSMDEARLMRALLAHCCGSTSISIGCGLNAPYDLYLALGNAGVTTPEALDVFLEVR